MKSTIFLILFILSQYLYSQHRGINIIGNKKSDTLFVKENKRVKVWTADGKKIAGNFTIVNDSVITIKGKIVPLDSITKITKASTLSTIVIPVTVIVGASFLTLGIAGAAYGGYGYGLTMLFVPPGLPLAIVPLATNKHRKEKYKYEIVN